MAVFGPHDSRNFGLDRLTWAAGARHEGFKPPTARSVAWCSTSDWSAPDGSGLLTLDASSIQTDPERPRRIVRMINGMIKLRRDEPRFLGNRRPPLG
jgi:hypothetical protein